MFRCCTNVLLTAAMVVATAGIVNAAPSAMASMAPVDCATAEHTMMMMPSMQPTMAPMTGNMDKDFAAMSAANARMVMHMAHMEMQCGKDAKTRAAAQALEEQQSQFLTSLMTIWGDSI